VEIGMNVRRFSARTTREALTQVRQSLGDDAVVLSTRPSADGVEILAMAGDSLGAIEQLGAPAPAAEPEVPPAEPTTVQQDTQRLSMSTLSFQDYVRERLLRRRAASMRKPAADADPKLAVPPKATPTATAAAAAALLEIPVADGADLGAAPAAAIPSVDPSAPRQSPPTLREALGQAVAQRDPLRSDARASLDGRPAMPSTAVLMLADEAHDPGWRSPAAPAWAARRDTEMLEELRSVKGLIEARFGALAFMDKLQRQPGQARLAQRLLECGFSPALIRKLSDGLPGDCGDEAAWAAAVLERNLDAACTSAPLEEQGGVYALVGSTGVGKTTTTAKIAAAFAARHGAANLGLITLDAYRVAAHEQLRAYGRILGVPVHTAHDRASLEDLLELLAGKRMVLIDTAGVAQRDARARELLDMLSHRSIRRLVVVNAASQGETIEDVLLSWGAAQSHGVVLSKIDEAVKLAPAVDAVIRHRLQVVGVANGQRVPEDWHRLSAHALVYRATTPPTGATWRLEATDVNLVFAGLPMPTTCSASGAVHAAHA
jgi:flagellar biosynthesis protein FlhF